MGMRERAAVLCADAVCDAPWAEMSMRDAVVNTCKRDLGPLQGRPSLFKRGSNRAFIEWYEVRKIQYKEILFKLISCEK